MVGRELGLQPNTRESSERTMQTKSLNRADMLQVAGAVMREDKHEVWIYYNALKHPSKLDDYRKFNQTDELHRLSVDPVKFEEQGGALSLAKLPIDRFVSVDAGMAGQLLTRAFEWKGEDLYINADSKWGEICEQHGHNCLQTVWLQL